MFGALWFLFAVVASKKILNPKYSFVVLDSFYEEHGITVLGNIGDLHLYTITNENYNSFIGSIHELFDVEEDHVYSINQVPWHLPRIVNTVLPNTNTFNYTEYGSCHTNPEVEIETVVVDTGVESSHIEFGENRPVFLENFSGDNINYDCNSHGTFCSSLIGGKTRGVCKDSKLFAVKVLSCDGSGTMSGVIEGIMYVYNRHVSSKNTKLRTIMSMSLGGPKSNALNKVIDKMISDSNTFYIVVASGNSMEDACETSPASSKSVFTVNAMDQYDSRAYFSNFGKCTDIYSPGVNIDGAVLDNSYAIESGTSFSTPILAGIMNHVLDQYPDLNMKQLKEKILSDATKDVIIGNIEDTPNLMVYLNRTQ